MKFREAKSQLPDCEELLESTSTSDDVRRSATIARAAYEREILIAFKAQEDLAKLRNIRDAEIHQAKQKYKKADKEWKEKVTSLEDEIFDLLRLCVQKDYIKIDEVSSGELVSKLLWHALEQDDSDMFGKCIPSPEYLERTEPIMNHPVNLRRKIAYNNSVSLLEKVITLSGPQATRDDRVVTFLRHLLSSKCLDVNVLPRAVFCEIISSQRLSVLRLFLQDGRLDVGRMKFATSARGSPLHAEQWLFRDKSFEAWLSDLLAPGSSFHFTQWFQRFVSRLPALGMMLDYQYRKLLFLFDRVSQGLENRLNPDVASKVYYFYTH